ncbi:MAG TPA: response regulator [Gemmatimonadales bacterium]|nr:response regulator [Gemmatimonadales bacterium]
MAEPRILLVDDDPDITRLMQQVLQTNGWGPAVEVTTGAAALASLRGIDIVLLDHQLPDTSGLEVLGAIRAQRSPPAVIVVTAHGNESLAAAALRMGADDYLAKDAALADLLPQIVERVRRNRELRKALAAAEEDLVRAERLAAIGEMTVTLHHEINNPLMAAFADVELLLSDTGTGRPQVRQGLESIKQALLRIRDILQQIGGLQDARSKDYLRGIRMLDLHGSGQVTPSVVRGAALLHLADEDLARIVSLLLRDAGFQVSRFQSIGELTAASSRIGVSLVVIAGGVSTPGSHPLSGFVPAPNRQYRLVALVGGSGESALRAGADHVMQLPFDPKTFIQEVTAQRS